MGVVSKCSGSSYRANRTSRAWRRVQRAVSASRRDDGRRAPGPDPAGREAASASESSPFQSKKSIPSGLPSEVNPLAQSSRGG